MGIVTDITIPGEQFELGSVLQRAEDTLVSFEVLVPSNGAIFPYLWAHTDDHEALCQHFRSARAVRRAQVVYQDDRRGLYDIEWEPETDGFLRCLTETKAIVLEAGGSSNRWDFKLRFDCQEDLSRFQEVCLDNDIALSVHRIVPNSAVDPPGTTLTQPQRETLELALEKGYFDVPRKTTMVELAEELGISDQAVSARLRRATKKLLQQLSFSETRERNRAQEPQNR